MNVLILVNMELIQRKTNLNDKTIHFFFSIDLNLGVP